jgi:type IV secretory pathway VirB2 component (pilin)
MPPARDYVRGKLRGKLVWTLILGLLLLASTEFLLRGPIRFARAIGFNDFISPYIQTNAWMKGVDPYSPRNLVALWPRDAGEFLSLKTDLADGSLVRKRGVPTAYPPTSFVLLAPLAWLPWKVAHHLWLGISLLAFAVTVLSLVSLIDFHWREKRTYLFLALALALAPFHTGLAAGSIVIVAVGFCALAMWAAERQWNVAAGVLFGIAVGLKPQIGLPFLVYYLLRRRWRVVTASATVVAILAATAVFQLTMHHTPWIDNYRYDNRILFGSGSLGDFTETNPLRFGLVNLQVLLYTFVPDRAAANVMALVMAGVLGLLWLLLLWRSAGNKDGDEMLDLSALAVLSLLPVYHRLYDASLLIFPLAWSLRTLPGPRKELAKGTLLLILVFLVPGGSALEQLQRTSHLVPLQHSWWWTHIVMPHQVWALLFLSVLLLVAIGTSPQWGRSACEITESVKR